MAMYSNLCGKINLLENILKFLIFKLTIPGFVLPALIVTITNYFMYDLGDKSFYLPFYAMYVISHA